MNGGAAKPRLVAINHLALEVGDIDVVLVFYGRIFDFTLRGRAPGHAFFDMGDQFMGAVARAQPSGRLESLPRLRGNML